MINQKQNGHILELEIATNELNTLDNNAFAALNQSLIAARDDDSVKVLVIRGKGEKFFSNGFE